ncbi:hypothetical protein VPHD485_0129 [Vibrio phage D485]
MEAYVVLGIAVVIAIVAANSLMKMIDRHEQMRVKMMHKAIQARARKRLP